MKIKITQDTKLQGSRIRRWWVALAGKTVQTKSTKIQSIPLNMNP